MNQLRKIPLGKMIMILLMGNVQDIDVTMLQDTIWTPLHTSAHLLQAGRTAH